MECLGAARDTQSFLQQLKTGSRPPASSLVYDGIFNEHYFAASTTTELLEPFGHSAVSRDGKLFLGVEIVSVLDGKPRDPSVPLDLILVIDISGSMNSSLGGEPLDKLEAVKGFAMELAEKAHDNDTISVIIFDDIAETLLRPTKKSDDGVKKVTEAVKDLKTRGGTTISCGLEEGIKIAREAKSQRGAGHSACRIVLLTDMSDYEVRSAEQVIQEKTTAIAAEGIYVTYVGVGEDFQHELTEKITVADGSNYFCIMNREDFTKRVANEFASAFFPTVKGMVLALLSKQYKVTGIWGAGKEGPFDEEDVTGWTLDKQHLYGESTQLSAQQMTEQNLPSDVVSLIVNQTDVKPTILAREASVFPSSSTERPGYMQGGWIIVGLEPEKSKGDAHGFVRFEARYTLFDGTEKKCVKEVDLGPAEKAIASGKREWYSSEGVEKAMILKQYVDVVRAVLDDKKAKEFPEDFLNWFAKQDKKYGLVKEREKLEKLSKIIKEETPSIFCETEEPQQQEEKPLFQKFLDSIFS